MDNRTIQQILTLRNFGVSGVVVNCACDNYAEVLAQASEQRFFNLTHEWLILDPRNLGMDTILNPVANINVDSLMTFVEPGKNGTWYLTDVYSRGRHLLEKFLVKTYAAWEKKQGFAILQQFPNLYHRDYRGNFENLTREISRSEISFRLIATTCTQTTSTISYPNQSGLKALALSRSTTTT
jgi:hypothetical protein